MKDTFYYSLDLNFCVLCRCLFVFSFCCICIITKRSLTGQETQVVMFRQVINKPPDTAEWTYQWTLTASRFFLHLPDKILIQVIISRHWKENKNQHNVQNSQNVSKEKNEIQKTHHILIPKRLNRWIVNVPKMILTLLLRHTPSLARSRLTLWFGLKSLRYFCYSPYRHTLRYIMYGTLLHYISNLQKLTVDFWLHTGHKQLSPECITWPSIPEFLCLLTFFLTSSFAAVMITTATRGRHLTANVNTASFFTYNMSMEVDLGMNSAKSPQAVEVWVHCSRPNNLLTVF